MTIHGLRPEFQPSNFEGAKKDVGIKLPDVIKPSTGEHEGIPSIHKKSSDITGLGQNIDQKL